MARPRAYYKARARGCAASGACWRFLADVRVDARSRRTAWSSTTLTWAGRWTAASMTTSRRPTSTRVRAKRLTHAAAPLHSTDRRCAPPAPAPQCLACRIMLTAARRITFASASSAAATWWLLRRTTRAPTAAAQPASRAASPGAVPSGMRCSAAQGLSGRCACARLTHPLCCRYPGLANGQSFVDYITVVRADYLSRKGTPVAPAARASAGGVLLMQARLLAICPQASAPHTASPASWGAARASCERTRACRLARAAGRARRHIGCGGELWKPAQGAEKPSEHSQPRTCYTQAHGLRYNMSKAATWCV